MKNVMSLLLIVLFVLMSLAGRESEAVIYQYVNEKGDPALVDDLQKVPEPLRSSARMVSGQVTTERSDDERLRDAARVAALHQERSILQAKTEMPKRSRLLCSGVAAAGVIIMLVIMANVDALKKRQPITDRMRMVLIALFIIYLGIMHGRDVVGLFSRAADTVQDVQDTQAEKGRRAAELYKDLDRLVDQTVKEQSRQEQER